MKVSWLGLLVTFVLALALVLGGACGDDDDDSDDDDDDNDSGGGDDDDDNNNDDDNDDDDGETWTDQDTGLMWQVTPDPEEFNWDDEMKSGYDVDEYCKSLEYGGYSDWRLPTISELRSIVRGCDATETEGSCGVTDTCLDRSSCYDQSCNGCSENQGPSNGCYWPNELEGPCNGYYSVSTYEDYESWAWYVSFGSGGVYNYSLDFPSFFNYVRCVR